MLDLETFSLLWIVLIFIACAAVIGLAGWKLAKYADLLADRTGIGEAAAGALFLGAGTSLPGSVASVTAAASGFPDLAISNAIGGLAVQTAFLGIADLCYRRANLEHAASASGNLMSAALLVVMLSIPLVSRQLPEVTWFGIHPATLLLPMTYLAGLHLLQRTHREPMWTPRQTDETRQDVAAEASGSLSLGGLWLRFGVCALAVAVAGYLISSASAELTVRTGLSQNAVGGVFLAIATSLPELITSVAAVKRGALTLAVSDIIGGNSFEVIFLAASDVVYREGSIYHEITGHHVLLITVCMLMTGVLLMGMISRQRQGPAGIGFEGAVILALYGGMAAYLLAS